MSNLKGTVCPICGDKAEVYGQDGFSDFVNCNSCGNFEIDTFVQLSKTLNKNELASYLYYNGLISHPINNEQEKFYNFIGEKNVFEEKFERYPWSYFVSKETVENWYPKTFSEKIDSILLGLAKTSKYDGDIVVLSYNQALSACFVKRFNEDGSTISFDERNKQLNFLINYLKETEYITSHNTNTDTSYIIKTKGIERIDLLQKRNSNSKTAFVAMSFAPEMKPIREAISSAIYESGYIPRIMDEIEHNHQIVPEMLYEIRQAKFIVTELTGHNNGAYFEEGYAIGLGKEVIQICKKEAFEADGHFDVKQVNTIMWEDAEQLKNALIGRIKATIS